jgi:putative PIN family toxin of toxin-antitoxin system
MISRIVLDTNVLISALLNPRGRPAQLLALIQKGSVRLCVCDDTLSEYTEVLTREKFSFDPALIEGTMAYLKTMGYFVIPAAQNINFSRDPKDEVFYNLAKTTDAVLVTGNARHFSDETDVMSPYEFLGRVTK